MGLFTAEDVATYLGVPRSAAYAILHRADCPTVAWGKRLYIRKDDLDKWVLQHRRDIASAGEGESYAR